MTVEVTNEVLQEVFSQFKLELGQRAFSSEKSISTLNYIICMLPRTGSTMLCSIMEQTGLMGFPDEYLNPRGVLQLYARRYTPGNIREYFNILRRERKTPNGIFGVKASYNDFVLIEDAELIGELLGPVRFIFLDRRDMLQQAISGVIAQQSGIWHRDASGAVYRSQAVAKPLFDEVAIVAQLNEYTKMRAQWEQFFALHSIDPVRLSYESLVQDLNFSIGKIARTLNLGADIHVDMAMSATSRLADDRNVEWADRMRQKYNARIRESP